MNSRLSKAPVLASALAIVIATAGYGLSQTQEWSLPGEPALQRLDYGPPMADGSVEETTEPEVQEFAEGDGTPPDVALRMLGMVPDAYPDQEELPPSVNDTENLAVAEASDAEGSAPEIVRTISLPRRDDPVNQFGEPVEEEDTYQLAALPQENVSATPEPEPAIDETLVAPIPAPAYRRPVSSYLPQTASRSVQPAPQQLDPTVVEPDMTQEFVWPGRLDQVNGSGPIRLDRVNQAQQAPVPVGQPVSPNNIFMSDWVEVSDGHYRRIVGR